MLDPRRQPGVVPSRVQASTAARSRRGARARWPASGTPTSQPERRGSTSSRTHTSSLTCTGALGRRPAALLEESSPWWEDDLRSSNARLRPPGPPAARAPADARRWRAHIGGGIPGGAAAGDDPATWWRGLGRPRGDLAGVRATWPRPGPTESCSAAPTTTLWQPGRRSPPGRRRTPPLAGRARDDQDEAPERTWTRSTQARRRVSPSTARSARSGRSTWPPSSTGSTAATRDQP